MRASVAVAKQPLPPAAEMGTASLQRLLSDLAAGRCRDGSEEDRALSARTSALLAEALGDGLCSLSPEEVCASSPDLPPADIWRQTLSRCRVAGTEAEQRLFVILPDGRIALSGVRHRWRQLADCLTQLVQSPVQLPSVDEQRKLMQTYFSPSDFTPEQRLAAGTALHSRLTLITGGPGTGKTTTVVRLAALMAEWFGSPEAVALTAYTGRAAMHMSMAREFAGGMGHGLSDRCFTLHRLLGQLPGGFRLQSQPHSAVLSGLKAVILDEASMVDMELFHELLLRLPDNCRLVLIGDANQLAPIGPGAPFSELCAASGPPLDLHAELAGMEVANGFASAPSQAASIPALSRLVRLERLFRYDEGSGLAQLAQAVMDDPQRAMQLLQASTDAAPDAEIRWLPLHHQQRAQMVGELARPWLEDGFVDDPEQALAHLRQYRVLSCRRTGEWGAVWLGQEIAARLQAAGKLMGGFWPPHTPVLVERNDYDADLRNGDLGVVLHRHRRAQAFFTSGSGMRYLPLWKLPTHSPGWAMTVHKSQGGEYQRVAVVLPPSPQLQSRMLLYTAITRARQQLLLIGSQPEIESYLQADTPPFEGLADLLIAAASQSP